MIVIPMAGLSSRFFREGYTEAKYRLPLHGKSVFYRAVSSFCNYFDQDQFLFVFRAEPGARDFIVSELIRLGVKTYRLVELPAETKGQADTVYQGTRDIPESEPLFIFNIDTIRLDFLKPDWIDECDGYLEVFRGEGDHWSFIDPGPDGTVLRTTEKDRISEFCSDCLYYFRRRQDFDVAFNAGESAHGELYVAPMYNHLIRSGCNIRYQEIEREQLLFCGTPAEYRELLDKASAFHKLTSQ